MSAAVLYRKFFCNQQLVPESSIVGTVVLNVRYWSPQRSLLESSTEGTDSMTDDNLPYLYWVES